MRYIGTGTFKPSPKAKHYVNDVLATERISYGPYSQRFEKLFATLHGCRYAVWSNSGTSSLLVALQTLKELHGWQDGDEVIVPSLTFVATINIVYQNRLKPVLVDIESDYYGIDIDKVQQSITDKTRCIIPVHTFGQPCDMLHLRDFNLPLIEDSCESMFVEHYDMPVGSWSDIACFSTYVAHLITTGVGGLATTNNPDYAKVMRSLVNHGRNNIYISIDDGKDRLQEVIGRRFEFERIGHSFRITELEAALGLAQLEDWQPMIKARQSNAAYLTKGLQQLPLQLPSLRPFTEHAFMMYPIVCLQDNIRDKLVRYLEDNGIETRRMLPLTNQPVYQFNEDDYPVAKWINHSGFYIGCHQDLSQDDLDYVIEKFNDFWRMQ